MRELQNVIERMMNYVHSNELTVDLMPADIIQRRRTSDFTDEFESPKDIEHQLLMKDAWHEALQERDGNKNEGI